VGCRFNPLRYRMGKAIQWSGSNLCVSALRNMTAKDPLQLEGCSGPWGGPVIARQAWSFDSPSGLFTHLSDDGKLMPLDHPLGSPAGTQLEIYPSTELDSQKWSLSSGVLFNEGLCLDVAFGNFTEYARLWFWPCHGGVQQRLFLPGDGTIRPIAAPNLCVDNDHDGSADGNPIQLFPCNGTQAQRWTFNGGALTNVRGCLDLNIAKGVVAGSLAQLWQCNGQANQTFQYFGQIKNKQGHCLDVREGVEGAGAVVQGAACTGAWSQDFYYVP
jgi:Ricin-type beta-trefoil lectin domain